MALWQETLLLVGIALVLAIGIKALLVQAFYIPSPSMEPLFVANDRILVQKVSYWGKGEPRRGDIIVFKDPGNWLDNRPAPNPLARGLEIVGLYPSGGHLVKRVIGIGGDRVVCCDKQGRLSVNGEPISEPYLPDGVAPSADKFDVRVPQDHLWMMGDNRSNSYDSRGHMGSPGGGFVNKDLVVGKVWALIWPPGRMSLIQAPDTFDRVPTS